jgi:dolichol-phosphate mannosyltransferase
MSKSNDMSMSIVIPIYNEAEGIIEVLTEVLQCLTRALDLEVIAVDDGSTDDTLGRMIHLRNRCNAPLRIIRHAVNFGQSTAIYTGIKAARAEWVVTLDGDGQNDPADIPRLIQILQDPRRPDNLQLICGFRYNRQDPWLKRIASWIANRFRGRLLNDGAPDTGCGLKLINRQAFLDLPFFDHMHRFLPALIQRNGGAVVSIAVNHRPRLRGRSKYGVWDRLWVGIIDLLGVLWLQRRVKRPIFEEVKDS